MQSLPWLSAMFNYAPTFNNPKTFGTTFCLNSSKSFIFAKFLTTFIKIVHLYYNSYL